MWSDIRIRRLPAIIDIGGSPNGVERSVQSKPGIDFPGELLWCRDNRFQRSAHIGIAMSLAAGKSAAIAAQEGKMRLNLKLGRAGVRERGGQIGVVWVVGRTLKKK